MIVSQGILCNYVENQNQKWWKCFIWSLLFFLCVWGNQIFQGHRPDWDASPLQRPAGCGAAHQPARGEPQPRLEGLGSARQRQATAWLRAYLTPSDISECWFVVRFIDIFRHKKMIQRNIERKMEITTVILCNYLDRFMKFAPAQCSLVNPNVKREYTFFEDIGNTIVWCQWW